MYATYTRAAGRRRVYHGTVWEHGQRAWECPHPHVTPDAAETCAIGHLAGRQVVPLNRALGEAAEILLPSAPADAAATLNEIIRKGKE
jgi:hypothetical protein